MNILNGLLFSQYKLHHISSTGLYIGLWKHWNFQSEAKEEQIIAIIKTRSISCWSLLKHVKIIKCERTSFWKYNVKQNICRSSHRRYSLKKAVLKNVAIFTGNHVNFIKKEIATQVFFCEYWEIFKNTYFEERLPTAATTCF